MTLEPLTFLWLGTQRLLFKLPSLNALKDIFVVFMIQLLKLDVIHLYVNLCFFVLMPRGLLFLLVTLLSRRAVGGVRRTAFVSVVAFSNHFYMKSEVIIMRE